jgi:hypothetical protein
MTIRQKRVIATPPLAIQARDFIAVCGNSGGPLRMQHLEVRLIAHRRAFLRHFKKTSLSLGDE